MYYFLISQLHHRTFCSRAENNVSCCAAEELPNELNKCRFTWIIDTNLKGWIPQRIVDKSMSTALVDFMICVRKYVDKLQGSSA